MRYPTLSPFERFQIKTMTSDEAIDFLHKKFGTPFAYFYKKAKEKGYTEEDIIKTALAHSKLPSESIPQKLTSILLSAPATAIGEVKKASEKLQQDNITSRILGGLQLIGAPFGLIGGLTSEALFQLLKTKIKPETAQTIGEYAGIGAEIFTPAGIVSGFLKLPTKATKLIPGIKSITRLTKAQEKIIEESPILIKNIENIQNTEKFQRYLYAKSLIKEYEKVPTEFKYKVFRKHGIKPDEVIKFEIVENLDRAIKTKPELLETIEGIRTSMLATLDRINRSLRPKMQEINKELNSIKAKYTEAFTHTLREKPELLKDPAKVDNLFHTLRTKMKELGGAWENFFAKYPELKGTILAEDEFEKLMSILMHALQGKPFEFERMTKALLDTLAGRATLQPKQVELLRFIFSDDYVKALKAYSKAIQDNSILSKFARIYAELNYATKQLRASFDISAPFRQGIGLISRPEFWKNLPITLKAYFVPGYSRIIDEAIVNHPRFEFAIKSGLQLTVAGLEKEELFMSKVLPKIPFVGKMLEKSETAFSGYLNVLRLETFSKEISRLERLGYHGEQLEKMAKEVANYINIMTGRGTYQFLNKYGNDLAKVFWAPRLYASRMQMLTNAINPKFWITLPKEQRMRVLFDYLGMATFGFTFLELTHYILKEMGYNVQIGTNPTSADFGKLIIDGKLRIDPWGGLQQYVVLFNRLLSGSYTSSLTGRTKELGVEGELKPGEFGKQTYFDFITRFVRQKVSPLVDFILDTTNIYKLEFHEKNDFLQSTSMFIPMVIEDFIDIFQNEMIEHQQLSKTIFTATFGTIASAIGMGVNYYFLNQHTDNLFTKEEIPYKRLVDKELEKHGLALPREFVYEIGDNIVLPLDKEVADYLYKVYVKLFYKDAFTAINHPKFKELPVIHQKNFLKDISIKNKTLVKDIFFNHSIKYQGHLQTYYYVLYKEMVNKLYPIIKSMYPDISEKEALIRAENYAKQGIQDYFRLRQERLKRALSKEDYEEIVSGLSPLVRQYKPVSERIMDKLELLKKYGGTKNEARY